MQNIFVKNHFYHPLNEIVSYWENKCNNFNKVLEIGPGITPFSKANIYIDSQKWNNPNINVFNYDIDVNDLSSLGNIDFVYCRHVMEDIQNPDFACKNLFRISKNGYIETPSPIVEILKNIDVFPLANSYRGYIHHRYLVWTELSTNTLWFMPKFPLIDHIKLDNNLENQLINLVNNNKYYWNNMYYWDEQNKPNVKIYKHGDNFQIQKNYLEKILNGIDLNKQSTENFIHKFIN